MRKYFLLSAVALLATSTANATTDYAEVTAKATIEVAAGNLCGSDTEMRWHIVVKQNNDDIYLTSDEYAILSSTSPDLISAELLYIENEGSGYDQVICNIPNNEYVNVALPDTVPLKNGDKSITFSPKLYTAANGNGGTDNVGIYGNLAIPANITAGDYIGTFTVSYTY